MFVSVRLLQQKCVDFHISPVQCVCRRNTIVKSDIRISYTFLNNTDFIKLQYIWKASCTRPLLQTCYIIMQKRSPTYHQALLCSCSTQYLPLFMSNVHRLSESDSLFFNYGFPSVIAPDFSTPAFSTPAICSRLFHSCFFHSCIFSAPILRTSCVTLN